jgi:hypothetical protein
MKGEVLPQSSVAYSALHTSEDDLETQNPMEHEEMARRDSYEEEEYDEMDYSYIHHRSSKKHLDEKKPLYESFDFNDCESLMWRKVSCISNFLYI